MEVNYEERNELEYKLLRFDMLAENQYGKYTQIEKIISNKKNYGMDVVGI